MNLNGTPKHGEVYLKTRLKTAQESEYYLSYRCRDPLTFIPVSISSPGVGIQIRPPFETNPYVNFKAEEDYHMLSTFEAAHSTRP